MKYCKVCEKLIPEARVKLGYKDTCVEHSDAFRYVGFVSGVNKVDYQMSIVRDRDTASHMNTLTSAKTES